MRAMVFTTLLGCACRCRAFIPAATYGLRQGSNGALVRRNFHATVTMKLKTGIVGLPNVGKSTLFNALTEQQAAQAENYPFCTIEPNVGVVAVPDPRLDVLGEINKSRKVIPTALEFVDIAGLVKGASKGEGLGNKFLANIRECDAIVHVVRCFEDKDIVHVEGTVDPVRDSEIINLELALADLAQVDKRLAKVLKEKTPVKEEKRALEKLSAGLNEGLAARSLGLDKDEEASVKGLMLLTAKPMIYAANVLDSELAGGNDHVVKLRKFAAEDGSRVVLVSAQVESELPELSAEDKAEFLQSLGVKEDECGLRALVKEAYISLGLQTYFTSGETETRAWTIQAGWKAPQAAGVIHSDFERGFIRAETISYEDLVANGSEKAAREKGLMRSEGKEYIVKEGDIMLFRFNV